MKLAIVSTLGFGLTLAQANYEEPTDQWQPPGPDDFRGPCPMLNTLANHGFLPHDGRQLTQDAIVDGLAKGLNFDSSLAELMFQMAIVANPEPNATFFTLDHLNVHNVLEHDASLRHVNRADDYFGNNHIFNQTIFDESRAYWTEDTMTPEMLANSKLARQIQSRASNPTYTFTSDMEDFSIGEVSAPIIAFGDYKTGNVERALVEYFFLNERLPTELGWSVREDKVTLDDILSVSDIIRNATSLITPSEEGEQQKLRARDLHAGVRADLGQKGSGCPYGHGGSA